MITLTREEAQQVLDALDGHSVYKVEAAIEFLRARLSAPEPEPLAWAWEVNSGAGYYTRGVGFDKTDIPFAKHTPLYTAPPQRKGWQGLTDEEIQQGNKESWVTKQAWESAVWWAEEKLKEKNT